MGGLLHLVQRGGRSRSPPRPLVAVPNVTAHPSTASVPIFVLLYNGPLLCGFNMLIKGLTCGHLRSCSCSGCGSCFSLRLVHDGVYSAPLCTADDSSPSLIRRWLILRLTARWSSRVGPPTKSSPIYY